jgi:mannose-6-phosphate isomerase-like protein (cupin superfamily)
MRGSLPVRTLAAVEQEEAEMPKVSKESATRVEDHGPVEERSEDVDGYTVNFLTFRVDIDGAPLLKGLPDDKCNCPHWGYVLNGKIVYHYGDRDEVFETGDAFYVPAGHTPEVAAGTEYLQFSPSEELRVVSEKMLENARELQLS